MKLTYNRTFRENDRMLMRQCGYYESYGRLSGDISFIRQLRRTPYPRFHIYINNTTSKAITLNLHLDAKKPSYGQKTHAHSGEYDSEIVRDEAQRITNIIKSL